MLTKQAIVAKAYAYGFGDVGFTSAEPFAEQKQLLESMQDRYDWTTKLGLDLVQGTDPRTVLSQAATIIVLMEPYFSEDYPPVLERYFGRCYLDDDRVTKDGLYLRIKAFRRFLRDHGIDSKVPFNLPHRVAAARAGLGNFGTNCLFYSRKVALKGSWVLPIAVVIDQPLEPDVPTVGNGCPDWCRKACVTACPTRALKGNGTIDPRRCISYMTYHGQEITPRELREPMGLYVYGCDRCQEICPRNRPWLTAEKPLNQRAAQKAPDFELTRLLHMDETYFQNRIWPHMFYMRADTLWKWKMNVARAMGNSLDPKYVPHLVQAIDENDDLRVLGMIAWALGRNGGDAAVAELKKWRSRSQDLDQALSMEIESALQAS